MTTNHHAATIRDFVVSNFLFGEAGTLQDETSFMGAGVIDSTGILELVMFLENTFTIKVQPEEMLPENFDSVNRVAEFVGRKLAPAPIRAS
jgi:acyl carrier protein